MPAAAVGASFAALGASAATAATVTTIVSAVYVGALYGAVISGATALFTGGDVLDSALKGAVIGGITGGVLKGVSLGTEASALGAAGEAAASGEAAATSVPQSTVAASQLAEGSAPGFVDTAVPSTAESAALAMAKPTESAVSAAESVPATQDGGLLSKISNWIETNPQQATIAAQTVGGAAKGLLESRKRESELAAAMERDRLRLQSKKIKGLSNLQNKIALPSIAKFTETPEWVAAQNG